MDMPARKLRFTRHLGPAVVVTSVCFLAPMASAETVYRIGNVGDPGSLDPAQISASYEDRVVGDMFMGLVTEAADGSVVPGAAESWTIDDDGRSYTFKLRNHKWSDGAPVTAEDFVLALRRVVDPGSAAPYAFQLYPILNAEKLNSGALQGMEQLGVSAEGPTNSANCPGTPDALLSGGAHQFRDLPRAQTPD